MGVYVATRDGSVVRVCESEAGAKLACEQEARCRLAWEVWTPGCALWTADVGAVTFMVALWQVEK